MPLQQLIEYYNDRLEWEHHTNFRPFIFENGVAYGLFGPLKIGSHLTPLRKTQKPNQVIGHVAHLMVEKAEVRELRSQDLDLLMSLPAQQSVQPESIVNFDRLSRTVHMFNYLPQSHLDNVLLLDVDPRHILGVKKDHGAYFEEVIVKVGLNTSNIVISLSVSSAFATYYQVLLKGLNNYRQRGYRLALKFDYSSLGSSAIDLIGQLEPNFVALSARNLDTVQDNQLLEKLYRLRNLSEYNQGEAILLNVADKKSAELARKTNFSLVQGNYYEQSPSIDNQALNRAWG